MKKFTIRGCGIFVNVVALTFLNILYNVVDVKINVRNVTFLENIARMCQKAS